MEPAKTSRKAETAGAPSDGGGGTREAKCAGGASSVQHLATSNDALVGEPRGGVRHVEGGFDVAPLPSDASGELQRCSPSCLCVETVIFVPSSIVRGDLGHVVPERQAHGAVHPEMVSSPLEAEDGHTTLRGVDEGALAPAASDNRSPPLSTTSPRGSFWRRRVRVPFPSTA